MLKAVQLAKETMMLMVLTTNAADVLIAHFDELVGRITTAAGGGIQSVLVPHLLTSSG